MALAVDAVLASTLWNAKLNDAKSNGALTATEGNALAFGLHSLDTILDGGLDYGDVACISSEADCGASNLCLRLIASHLLAGDNDIATIVDTTLSFDLRGLHQRIVVTLQGQGRDASAAMTMLERLKIMKVFDFVGLTESISEVRTDLDTSSSATVEAQSHPVDQPRGTVADSDDEEEMLDEEPPKELAALKPLTSAVKGVRSRQLLIVDSISHVALPLLKRNAVQGNAVLTSFMRSLRQLTQAHGLCTVLFNGATAYANAKDESPSIFASCTLRPAMGRSFALYMDLHMLLHTIPKTADDAKAAYGGMQQRELEVVSVLEVLQDRHCGRGGRWTGLAMAADGHLEEIR
ncbi:hypothetical protein BAUCODRAFT_144388 [Baudoinia panamericana UAMH 10762]|uniref:DNA recombination and repair protein Rad51-like C-terminal domain-containing protein n=1 Tax=Baudoinia panamericana (strain UAMH 10762) TaxID=717646 RepID=M2N9B6_BAUPA|nr:uncharacterized protein BAUCODRAFT_144388 [Baudoinia panamericana UAMH 10762]EMD00769.1 hypothetical protein BAUCODRAFT_144388 [Baudoinia panamericana UAMH 10762]